MIVSALSVALRGSNSTRLLKHGIAGHTVEIVDVSWMAKPWGRSSRCVMARVPPGLGVCDKAAGGTVRISATIRRGSRKPMAASSVENRGEPRRRPASRGVARRVPRPFPRLYPRESAGDKPPAPASCAPLRAAAQDAAVSPEDSGTSTSTRRVNFRPSPDRRAPTPTTRRATISSRSSWTSMSTEYSHDASPPGCRIVPSTVSGETADRGGLAMATASNLRCRRQAGHVGALRRMRSPQWGQFQASPVIGDVSVRRRLRLGRVEGLDFSFLPAELDLAAHLRPGRHGEASRLEVTDQRPGLLELNPRVRNEVTAHLAADQHGVGLDLAVDGRAGLDRQLALHVDVALEASGDPDVAVAFDLPLDGEARGEDRLGAFGSGHRHRGLLCASRGCSHGSIRRNHRRRRWPLESRLVSWRWLGFRSRLLLAGLLSEQCHVLRLLGAGRRAAQPPRRYDSSMRPSLMSAAVAGVSLLDSGGPNAVKPHETGVACRYIRRRRAALAMVPGSIADGRARA